jgi:hypothetical protein
VSGVSCHRKCPVFVAKRFVSIYCPFFGHRVCTIIKCARFSQMLALLCRYDRTLWLLRLASSVICGSIAQAIYIALLVMSYTVENIFYVFLPRSVCERAKKIPQVGFYLSQSPSEVEGLVIKAGSA